MPKENLQFGGKLTRLKHNKKVTFSLTSLVAQSSCASTIVVWFCLILIKQLQTSDPVFVITYKCQDGDEPNLARQLINKICERVTNVIEVEKPKALKNPKPFFRSSLNNDSDKFREGYRVCLNIVVKVYSCFQIQDRCRTPSMTPNILHTKQVQ